MDLAALKFDDLVNETETALPVGEMFADYDPETGTMRLWVQTTAGEWLVIERIPVIIREKRSESA